MKVTVLQEDFSKALAIASRFTSPKVQLPVLANVLLTAEKNSLLLSATNLEISVCLSTGCEIEEEGSITIPARTLFDIVTNLAKGKVTLETKGDTVSINAKGFKSTVTGMNASDFPGVPKMLGKISFPLSSKDFSDALSKVMPAVSIDESRPILTGVLFIFNEAKMQLVATDGFRLSKKALSTESKGDSRIIVPKGILAELIRLKDEDEKIELSYTKEDNQLIVRVGKSIISSRLIDGDFPDFERIIPKSTTMAITLGTADFARAVKIASVFARDSANVVKLKVNKKSVEVMAESSQKGNQSTELDADVKVSGDVSDNFVIAFNCKFLEDFINSAAGDEIEIDCTDPSAPCVFKDLSSPEFLHIIMPIRLQN
jgi:DNA polymerase III subunit beta